MKRIFTTGLVLASLTSPVFAKNNNNLSDSIPYPYYAVQKSIEGHSNKMMILNSGVESLKKRIDIIRKAKSHIEVEYFIYALDTSAKIFTQELIKKAKEGVKVRILIDKSAAVFVFDEYYAKALKEVGIEVRYYNDASLIRVSTVNFRNHRKLLSVDDKYAITGGRNIEDDYFDMSDEFNFIDRDVYVEGDIVKVMRESFDKFFDNKMSERVKGPRRPKQHRSMSQKRGHQRDFQYELKLKKHERNTKAAMDFMVLTDAEKEILSKIERVGDKNLENNKLIECPEVTYSTDAPGGNFFTRLFQRYGDKYRFLRKTLFDKARSVDKEIIVSSPYMINSPKSLEIYNVLIDRGVDIKLYTNSMASTDALYVAANLYRSVTSWGRNGIRTFIHSGEYSHEEELTFRSARGAKWGTHSKTQLYEYHDESQNEFMIGTYNIDNRSNHYNTEMALFCKGSPELYNELKENVNIRLDESYEIHPDFTATTKNGKKVSVLGANKDDLALMAAMAIPSWLLNLLL